MKDKYEIVAEVMESNNYSTDDLAKLLCRMILKGFAETGASKGSLKKVICGEGKKFTLTIKMEDQ